MTIEHHLLSGAALHNSKVLTFTGDPAAYVPPESGILVCCLTSPNAGKLYRTTGTTAGAVSLLAAGVDGAAATISIGDVTTGAAGSPAVVTNSGTASAAILDFELPTGPQGDPGNTILSGTGAPDSGLGANGDFYLDTTADAIYGPKTGGAWGAATPLVGPAGSGINVFNQAETPASASQGDLWIVP